MSRNKLPPRVATADRCLVDGIPLVMLSIVIEKVTLSLEHMIASLLYTSVCFLFRASIAIIALQFFVR